ncbi:cupin domain-containing protein [Candidatus Poribacteria bacterium]|nr:cupin domain-containing protein [Candidatus Poribacteria bacterium]
MDTNLCVIHLSEGERIGDALGNVLDTPDMTTIGAFAVSKENPTELHYHDFDEYWYFTEGITTVTLRTPDGKSQSYRIGPGDLVVTPKGVEHGHTPDNVVQGVQWVSVIPPDARRGHLHRDF